MHGIAQCPYEPVASQLAIVLHVADGRFNGASVLDSTAFTYLISSIPCVNPIDALMIFNRLNSCGACKTITLLFS
jgi:hypothetical protein